MKEILNIKNESCLVALIFLLKIVPNYILIRFRVFYENNFIDKKSEKLNSVLKILNPTDIQ